MQPESRRECTSFIAKEQAVRMLAMVLVSSAATSLPCPFLLGRPWEQIYIFCWQPLASVCAQQQSIWLAVLLVAKRRAGHCHGSLPLVSGCVPTSKSRRCRIGTFFIHACTQHRESMCVRKTGVLGAAKEVATHKSINHGNGRICRI